MNKMKFMVLFMSIAMIFGSCGSMNNTGKGADNSRRDGASDAVEYSLHGDFEHHKKLRISVDTEEYTSGFVGRLFGDEYGKNFIPEEQTKGLFRVILT